MRHQWLCNNGIHPLSGILLFLAPTWSALTFLSSKAIFSLCAAPCASSSAAWTLLSKFWTWTSSSEVNSILSARLELSSSYSERRAWSSCFGIISSWLRSLCSSEGSAADRRMVSPAREDGSEISHISELLPRKSPVLLLSSEGCKTEDKIQALTSSGLDYQQKHLHSSSKAHISSIISSNQHFCLHKC